MLFCWLTASVAVAALSVFLLNEFYGLKEMLVSTQEKVDAFAARVAAAGAELTDSFVKVADEVKSLKDQIAATPAAEVVDYAALDAAIAGVEEAAKAFDGLEPPVVEAPVDPAPVEDVPAPVEDAPVEVPVDETVPAEVPAEDA